jgi:hypothetical protein
VPVIKKCLVAQLSVSLYSIGEYVHV